MSRSGADAAALQALPPQAAAAGSDNVELRVCLARVPGAAGQPQLRTVEVPPDADVLRVIHDAYRGQARVTA